MSKTDLKVFISDMTYLLSLPFTFSFSSKPKIEDIKDNHNHNKDVEELMKIIDIKNNEIKELCRM